MRPSLWSMVGLETPRIQCTFSYLDASEGVRGETVPLSRFNEYYKELARDNNQGFRQQFEVSLKLQEFQLRNAQYAIKLSSVSVSRRGVLMRSVRQFEVSPLILSDYANCELARPSEIPKAPRPLIARPCGDICIACPVA